MTGASRKKFGETLRHRARQVLAECLPWPLWGSAEEKADETEKGNDFRTRTESIDGFARQLTEDSAKVLNALAKESMAAEVAREASVMSRAQALLVAQAFLAAVLALAGANTFPGASSGGWTPWAAAALMASIVVQAFLMTLCALRALRGASHVRLSYSDYEAIVNAGVDGGTPAKGLADSEEGEALAKGRAEAEMAVRSLNIYRRTMIRNNDRFEHLELAQRGLRNTCFLLCLLVLLVVALNMFGTTSRQAALGDLRLPRLEMRSSVMEIPRFEPPPTTSGALAPHPPQPGRP